MLEKNLKDLGLSSEEIRIYLALLEFGTSSVAGISRLTKIGRINCYHHIEKLLKKGFIRRSEKSKIAQFSAENPRVFINRQMEKLNLAKDLVPELLALSSQNPRKPRIQFFEGKAGIKNIFDQMLEHAGGEIVSFSNFEKLSSFLPEFLPHHFEERLEQKIKTRFISPRTKTAEEFQVRFFPKKFDERLLEIFLISSEEFYFDSDISIFGGSIAIMNLSEENPVGVLIENPELFRTQKTIFDLAWLGATSFITQ